MLLVLFVTDSVSRAVVDAMPKGWIGNVPVGGAEEHAACSRVLIVAPSKWLPVLERTHLKKTSNLHFHLVRVD